MMNEDDARPVNIVPAHVMFAHSSIAIEDAFHLVDTDPSGVSMNDEMETMLARTSNLMGLLDFQDSYKAAKIQSAEVFAEMDKVH
jgi:hypothetical protein